MRALWNILIMGNALLSGVVAADGHYGLAGMAFAAAIWCVFMREWDS